MIVTKWFSGRKFFDAFSKPLTTSTHSKTLHHLSTLLLPSHVQQDDLAQRFRNEKYVLRMSRSGFSLLVGWLTEGIGGEAPGSGEGFSGEKGRRGRASIMRVVNNHLRFDGRRLSKDRLFEPPAHLTCSDNGQHDVCSTFCLGGIDRVDIVSRSTVWCRRRQQDRIWCFSIQCV